MLQPRHEEPGDCGAGVHVGPSRSGVTDGCIFIIGVIVTTTIMSHITISMLIITPRSGTANKTLSAILALLIIRSWLITRRCLRVSHNSPMERANATPAPRWRIPFEVHPLDSARAGRCCISLDTDMHRRLPTPRVFSFEQELAPHVPIGAHDLEGN